MSIDMGDEIFVEEDRDIEEKRQETFEVLVDFFNNHPYEKYSYHTLHSWIGYSGRYNLGGNIGLLLELDFINRDLVEDEKSPDGITSYYSRKKEIPSNLCRIELVRIVQQETSMDKLFRRLKNAEEAE